MNEIVFEPINLTSEQKEAIRKAFEEAGRKPYVILASDSEIKFLPDETKSTK